MLKAIKLNDVFLSHSLRAQSDLGPIACMLLLRQVRPPDIEQYRSRLGGSCKMRSKWNVFVLTDRMTIACLHIAYVYIVLYIVEEHLC